MFKTIVVTWNSALVTDRGAININAALWMAEGDDARLNSALAFTAKENRAKSPYRWDYRVHTFACDEPQWKDKAIAAARLKYGGA